MGDCGSSYFISFYFLMLLILFLFFFCSKIFWMGSKSYILSYIDIFAATNFSLLRNQCEQNYLFFNHAETEIYFKKPEIENVWNFLYSDIKNAWLREQVLQWEEIENSGRRAPEALDGQCVTHLDIMHRIILSPPLTLKKMKFLYFRVIDFTVSADILIAFFLCSWTEE